MKDHIVGPNFVWQASVRLLRFGRGEWHLAGRGRGRGAFDEIEIRKDVG